jgi:outer membrane protein OmpA-like peptidoglycan-associated protein
MFHNKEEAEESFWISYADLATGFMMAFIVISLLLYNRDEETNKIKSKYAELAEVFKDKFKDEPSIEVNESEGTVRFLANDGQQVLFADNSDELTPYFKALLNRFTPIYFDEVQRVRRDSAESRVIIKEIRIEGHASNTGSYVTNLDLSSRRALSVYRFVASSSYYNQQIEADFRKFIQQNTISCGYSFSRPIDSKGKVVLDSDDGIPDNDKSRRVEFRILLEYKPKDK